MLSILGKKVFMPDPERKQRSESLIMPTEAVIQLGFLDATLDTLLKDNNFLILLTHGEVKIKASADRFTLDRLMEHTFALAYTHRSYLPVNIKEQLDMLRGQLELIKSGKHNDSQFDAFYWSQELARSSTELSKLLKPILVEQTTKSAMIQRIQWLKQHLEDNLGSKSSLDAEVAIGEAQVHLREMLVLLMMIPNISSAGFVKAYGSFMESISILQESKISNDTILAIIRGETPRVNEQALKMKSVYNKLIATLTQMVEELRNQR